MVGDSKSPFNGILPPPLTSDAPGEASLPSQTTQSKPITYSSRRMFDVDGTPLAHWDKKNFEPERDETCRVVYKPKGGQEFFERNLESEDFEVMRTVSIEQPFFSKYNRFFPRRGHFCCKACGNPLYSHQAKLKTEDGWPAFGACVEGAVGLTTAEERMAQMEKETKAVIKIQAFVRGCLDRASVNKKLGLLIKHLTRLQEEQESEVFDEIDFGEEEEPFDAKPRTSTHAQSLGALSLHSLDDFSVFDDSSCSGDSFMGASERDFDAEDESWGHSKHSKHSRSQDSAKSGKSSTSSKSRPSAAVARLGEEFVEIHCHRCKSHIGNIFAEKNRGRDYQTLYRERHRVNGRALKYVEDNLPKRTNANSSLLFANRSQRRLLGLKPAESKEEEEDKNNEISIVFAKTRNAPFVSPRSKRQAVRPLYTSPSTASKPGVGVRFQSPIQSPKGKVRQRKKNLENFFLSRSVH
eukprot:Nitzschia sp. Nitz4//scaffold261_size27179//17819//19216//NITZ4_008214-RA/size27179-processed-gene-0.13-mRNA-1//1//CDS//3329544732//4080//frame0